MIQSTCPVGIQFEIAWRRELAENKQLREALAELVTATREKWRNENGSLRQYKAVLAAERLLKK